MSWRLKPQRSCHGLDVRDVDSLALSIQCSSHLYILAAVLLGFVRIVQIEARAGALVDQQGVLSVLRLDDLTNEGSALLLLWLWLSAGRLTLRLCVQGGGELN